MKTLRVKDVVLGQGKPKICISLTGETEGQLLEEALLLQTLPRQLVEWRADFFLNQLDMADAKEKGKLVLDTLRKLRMKLELPILFTIRTKKEGGVLEVQKEDYYKINSMVADSGLADIIDIELFDSPETIDEKAISAFLERSHSQGIKVLLSSHDFHVTPGKEEMLTRYFVMQELGADISKLSVMPNNEQDVIDLLEVAAIMGDTYAENPFIAISMGELGKVTRICGGAFGSAITYAVGKEASAPGQIDAVTLEAYLSEYD